jgi:uncharacterized repeat protein (TIGR02543 family)
MRGRHSSPIVTPRFAQFMSKRPRLTFRFLVRGLCVLALFASSIVVALPADAFPINHTVTFLENDNIGDQVLQLESSTVPAPLDDFSTLSPSFSNPGYTFVGWNTSADGTGISFTDGEMYSFATDTGMYAQWVLIPASHSVTFFENDSLTDSVIAFMTASQPTQLTSFSNIQPVFQDAGKTFAGWNTAPDGSGTPYADASLYAFTTDVGLYAQWNTTVVNHSVTFRENASATDVVTSSQTMSVPASITAFAVLQPAFVNSGHSFLDWNTAPDGTGDSYADGSAFDFSSDMTLYAQWTLSAVPQVTITLNQGNSGSTRVIGMLGSSTILPVLNDSLDPGFTFVGWNSTADGSGTAFAGGASIELSSDTTLFAQWTVIPATFTVSFDANGGSGTISSLSGKLGGLVTIPGQSGLIRIGFVLTSWNTEPNGKGSSYDVGQVIGFSNSFALFAQWRGHKPVTLFGAIGSFKGNSSSLSSALKSQVDRIALTIKLKKFSSVTLYGYTAATGLASLNISLSRARALHVAQFLRLRLTRIKAKGVVIRSAGEGAIAGETGSSYSRVEVFGV